MPGQRSACNGEMNDNDSKSDFQIVCMSTFRDHICGNGRQ